MLYSDMTPMVAIGLPGCPDFLIERVLRDEIVSLYADKPIWLYTDIAATIGTDGVLTMALPAETQIHNIRAVQASDGTSIKPVTVDELQFRHYADSGVPQVVFELNDQYVVRPTPAATMTVTVVAHIGPTELSTGVVDATARKHLGIYQNLALSTLQAQAFQTWSNPASAGYNAMRAMEAIAAEMRKADGWSAMRAPVVRYGGIL